MDPFKKPLNPSLTCQGDRTHKNTKRKLLSFLGGGILQNSKGREWKLSRERRKDTDPFIHKEVVLRGRNSCPQHNVWVRENNVWKLEQYLIKWGPRLLLSTPEWSPLWSEREKAAEESCRAGWSPAWQLSAPGQGRDPTPRSISNGFRWMRTGLPHAGALLGSRRGPAHPGYLPRNQLGPERFSVSAVPLQAPRTNQGLPLCF